MKIFNASGHKINQDGVEVVGTANIPNVAFDNTEAILETAQAIADAAAPAVLRGHYVALPGASILAVHILTAIHGLTGCWPRVAWASCHDGVFVWGEEFSSSLHEFRTAQRVRRNG